jgi:hypothetical protein
MRLRIKALCKSNHLVRLDCDAAKAMDVTLDVILEVAIIDWGIKHHLELRPRMPGVERIIQKSDQR